MLLALAGASACNKPPSGGDGKLTIAVIPKGTSHVFWQSIHAGADKAAQELGVEIIWRGPLREDDRDSQVSEVEGFVTRGVSGHRAGAAGRDCARCARRGRYENKIPVVIIDSGLKGNDYVSFVATDNRQGGRLAGEASRGKALGGKGKVVMLRYAEGSESTTQREEGFLEAIAANPGIKVRELESVRRRRCGGRVQEERGAAEPLQGAGRPPGDRRHLLSERVDDAWRCCACSRTTGGPAR